MALHSGHRCVCASRMHLWISLSIAVSALTPVRIDKLCGRTNSEVAGKTHRSARLPLPSPPFLPSPLANFALCRIYENGGKARLRFLFWQNTHVYSSARFDVLSPRNDRLGLAERKIGSAGWGERGENWIRVSAQRTTSSVLVTMLRSLLRFWIWILDAWFQSGWNLADEQWWSFFFLFFLNIEALFIERIKFVIFVSKM